MQGFNKTILHTYSIDEVTLAISAFSDETGKEYRRIEVTYGYDRADRWPEIHTIEKNAEGQWMVTSYAFYDENQDFYIMESVPQPDAAENCILLGAWGAEPVCVNFDMGFQTFNRQEAQELLEQSFDYETLKQIGNG